MPTNPNMVAIRTVTVDAAGGAASIDFTNIPQTYTDLVLKLSARSTQTDFEVTDVNVELNGSTANQTQRNLRAYPTTNVISQTRTDITLGNMPSAINTASTFANSEMYIANYTSSNNKSISVDGVSESNTNSGFYWWVNMGANLWSNSAAITSITLKANSGAQNFAQYSTATLYGVLNYADWQVQDGAKARGGIVTSDANYWYHTFTSTAPFTPTQSLTADILVVAGGGGGFEDSGTGGAGAGGLQAFTSQALSATSYAVTIGAGGGKGANGSNSQFGSLTASVGGGCSNARGVAGSSGGSGGGGSSTSSGTGATVAGGAGTSGQGNAGGSGQHTSGVGEPGGGGGGAGAAGENGVAGSGTLNGDGGNGSSAYSSWGLATNTGENVSGTVYYAGGGAGFYSSNATSGYGGGGSVTGGRTNTVNGLPNTGGGGTSGRAAGGASGIGGSGIVIVRYAK